MTGFSNQFIKTQNAERAFQMCQSVMSARDYSRMGQIIGEPGTGKSSTTKWLVEELGGIRVEAFAGISGKELLVLLVNELNKNGHGIDPQGTSSSLFLRLKEVVGQQLIIVDEANHLTWQILERLRSLSDQAGAAIVLAGTDILERRIRDPRIQNYLKQLSQRIGAKRVYFNSFSDAGEFAQFVISPRFGQVAKTTAEKFLQHSKGNWRLALELGDAIERVLKVSDAEKLTASTVVDAAKFLAVHQ